MPTVAGRVGSGTEGRASITPYSYEYEYNINSRDGTVRYAMARGPTVPYEYREQHRAASADTKIGFVRYDYERDVRLRNDFFGNP